MRIRSTPLCEHRPTAGPQSSKLMMRVRFPLFALTGLRGSTEEQPTSNRFDAGSSPAGGASSRFSERNAVCKTAREGLIPSRLSNDRLHPSVVAESTHGSTKPVAQVRLLAEGPRPSRLDGQGRRPLTSATRVRIPRGTLHALVLPDAGARLRSGMGEVRLLAGARRGTTPSRPRERGASLVRRRWRVRPAESMRLVR